jgi:hypothetical protein
MLGGTAVNVGFAFRVFVEPRCPLSIIAKIRRSA